MSPVNPFFGEKYVQFFAREMLLSAALIPDGEYRSHLIYIYISFMHCKKTRLANFTLSIRIQLSLYGFPNHGCPIHRRRIDTEEKAKVVAAVWRDRI